MSPNGVHPFTLLHRSGLSPLSREPRPWRGLVAALLLAACASTPGLGTFATSGTKSFAQFTRASLGQIWAPAPEALVLVQRGSGTDAEQIIGLENATSLAGDNFLWFRAVDRELGDRFNLEDLVQRVGGVPSPFTTLDNRSLRNATDSMGTYFWQEYRSGTQTNCVIAFRRLKGGARALPNGARGLEVFLRNCVNGAIEDALAPIRDFRIGQPLLAGGAMPAGGGRSLSPLAAPRT